MNSHDFSVILQNPNRNGHKFNSLKSRADPSLLGLEAFCQVFLGSDAETFKDYLITNLKLYFDKWEKELSDVVEPTTDEYETEKEEGESEELGDELGGEDELGAEEEFGEEELEL